MVLEGSLQIVHNEEAFGILVKTFLKNGTYYFFVTDKEKKKALLDGETLELTYTGSFCPAEQDEQVENKKIPAEIVSAIENVLLENKQLWVY